MSSMLNKLTGHNNATETTSTTGTHGVGNTVGSSTSSPSARTGATTGSGLGNDMSSRAGVGSSTHTTGSHATGAHTGIGEEVREWATAHMEHDARVAFTGKSTTANVMSQNQATNVEIPAQTMTATLPAKRVVVEVPERQVEVQLPARQLQLENQPEIEVRTHPTIRSVATGVINKAESAMGVGHHQDHTASATSGAGVGRNY